MGIRCHNFRISCAHALFSRRPMIVELTHCLHAETQTQTDKTNFNSTMPAEYYWKHKSKRFTYWAKRKKTKSKRIALTIVFGDFAICIEKFLKLSSALCIENKNISSTCGGHNRVTRTKSSMSQSFVAIGNEYPLWTISKVRSELNFCQKAYCAKWHFCCHSTGTDFFFVLCRCGGQRGELLESLSVLFSLMRLSRSRRGR